MKLIILEDQNLGYHLTFTSPHIFFQILMAYVYITFKLSESKQKLEYVHL